MTHDDLRALITRQPFSPFTMHLADGRAFAIHHRDYLLIPPERSAIVFVFHRGGKWDIVYLKEITSISGEGDMPPMSGKKGESDAA